MQFAVERGVCALQGAVAADVGAEDVAQAVRLVSGDEVREGLLAAFLPGVVGDVVVAVGAGVDVKGEDEAVAAVGCEPVLYGGGRFDGERTDDDARRACRQQGVDVGAAADAAADLYRQRAGGDEAGDERDLPRRRVARAAEVNEVQALGTF